MTPEQLAAEADELAGRLRARAYYVDALDRWTNTEGAAAALGCSVKTLERWRDSGEGPRARLHNKRIRYVLRELVAHLDAAAEPTSTDIDGHRALDDEAQCGTLDRGSR